MNSLQNDNISSDPHMIFDNNWLRFQLTTNYPIFYCMIMIDNH